MILLDLKMPGIGGLETCRLIRERSEVPIMIVSARKTERGEGRGPGERRRRLRHEAARHRGTGCPHPCRHQEAFRRRALAGSSGLDSVEIDLESHEVKRGDTVGHLTSKEFRLLHYFLQNAGKVVSHRRLLQAVWGPDYGNEVEYLRVFINQLRKKIEPDPSHPKYHSHRAFLRLPLRSERQGIRKIVIFSLFCLCNLPVM